MKGGRGEEVKLTTPEKTTLKKSSLIKVNRSSGNMLTHALLSFHFFIHGFMQICFNLFKVFCFCFMSKKYCLSKLVLEFAWFRVQLMII